MEVLPHKLANPHYEELNVICRALPLELKKKIMTCLRVGTLPWSHPRIRKLVGDVETETLPLFSRDMILGVVCTTVTI